MNQATVRGRGGPPPSLPADQPIPRPVNEQAQEGRKLVQDHILQQLRERFGFSRSAQAHMIGVSPTALREWEAGVPLSRRSAERVSEWYFQVASFVDSPEGELLGLVSSGELVHVTVASQRLAMSYGTIIRQCRTGLLQCADLGPLGLYVYRDALG